MDFENENTLHAFINVGVVVSSWLGFDCMNYWTLGMERLICCDTDLVIYFQVKYEALLKRTGNYFVQITN